jgi:ferredoxin
LKTLIGSAENVLVVGCGTCVTVCFAGGAREAAITAASLRMATKLNGNGRSVSAVTVQPQCEWEYLDQIAEYDPAAQIRVGEIRDPQRSLPSAVCVIYLQVSQDGSRSVEAAHAVHAAAGWGG